MQHFPTWQVCQRVLYVNVSYMQCVLTSQDCLKNLYGMYMRMLCRLTFLNQVCRFQDMIIMRTFRTTYDLPKLTHCYKEPYNTLHGIKSMQKLF